MRTSRENGTEVGEAGKTIGIFRKDANVRPRKDGGRSSMVELQFVVLAVAGSSPVDHPIFLSEALPQIKASKSG